MKASWPITVAAWMYAAIGVLLLVTLPWLGNFTARPLDAAAVGTVIIFSAVCLYLGYAGVQARVGTLAQKKRFGVIAGIFCGSMGGLGGLGLGVVLGFPLLVALFGMRDILWKS